MLGHVPENLVQVNRIVSKVGSLKVGDNKVSIIKTQNNKLSGFPYPISFNNTKSLTKGLSFFIYLFIYFFFFFFFFFFFCFITPPRQTGWTMKLDQTNQTDQTDQADHVVIWSRIVHVIIVWLISVIQLGRSMQKRVFGHMRTANAQISLRIRAGWSGHSLHANKSNGHYRM